MNKLKLLKDGLRAIQEFSDDQDKLEQGLRILSPSGTNIMEFGNAFIDQYISTISEALDDPANWVSWYVFETNFGKKKMEVRTNGKLLVIDTPEKLLKLIEGTK